MIISDEENENNQSRERERQDCFLKVMINIEREGQKVKRKMDNESERRKWNGEERWKQNGFQPLKTKRGWGNKRFYKT